MANLNFLQSVILSRLEDPSEKSIDADTISNICCCDFVYRSYKSKTQNNKEGKKGRKEAIEIAARIIEEYGNEIKKQLQKNDNTVINSQENKGSGQQAETLKSGRENTTPDISKISGGTLSEVIDKITAILATRRGNDLDRGIDNFTSLFEVLGKIPQKLDEAMQKIANDPVFFADVYSYLLKSGNDITINTFNSSVDRILIKEQRQNISQVSEEDIENRREEKRNIQQRESSIYK